MAESGIQVCSVCGAKIQTMIGGDRVLFAVGPPGTRATLRAKVCQYTDKAGCINKDKDISNTTNLQKKYSSGL